MVDVMGDLGASFLYLKLRGNSLSICLSLLACFLLQKKEGTPDSIYALGKEAAVLVIV